MSDDVLITPASRKIEFKDSSGNVDGKIELDSAGNLVLTSPGGGIEIGDASSDIFVGDGSSNIDIIFEQNGEIRGTTGRTLTLGQSDSNIAVNALNFTSGGNEVMTSASLFPSGTTTTGLPTAGALNLANPPENDNHVFHPYLHNDLGHFIERGGTYAWAGLSSNPSADSTKKLFTANDDFVQILDSTISGSTYTLTLTNLPKTLAYSAYAGIVFCHDNFAPGSMVIETSTNGGSSYTTRLTDSSSKVVYACTFDSGSTATNAIRFTFSAAPGSGEVRISTITAYDYNSNGMENYFLPLRGGNVYGNVNLKGSVTINDAYTFPTSDGNNAQVLATNGSGTISFQSVGSLAGSGIQNVSDDTSPQLGGDLSTAGNEIHLSNTSGVAIRTTGTLSSADLTLLRASSRASEDGQYGFDIRYMGSRTGNNNGFALEMHNQTGTNVEAITALQDGKVGINKTAPTTPLHVGGDITGDGDFTLISTDAGATAGPSIILNRDSASPAYNDLMGELVFKGDDSAGNSTEYAVIRTKIASTTNGSEGGNLSFNVMQGGSEQEFLQMAFNNLYVNKQLTMFNNIFLDGNHSIKWDGSTNDSNTTSLVVTDPTAVRTITLPDATGTVTLNTATQTLTNKTLTSPTVTSGLALSNSDITGVNSLYFNDPGSGEGLRWNGGNMKLFESPDNLSNAAGNLQVTYNDARRFTVSNSGAEVVGTLTTSGGITFSDGTTQTSAGASTGFSIAMATALG